MSHPNILKLIGVQGDMSRGPFITVSEWMTHGNIMEYIENHSVNRLELVRALHVPHFCVADFGKSCTGQQKA